MPTQAKIEIEQTQLNPLIYSLPLVISFLSVFFLK